MAVFCELEAEVKLKNEKKKSSLKCFSTVFTYTIKKTEREKCFSVILQMMIASSQV